MEHESERWLHPIVLLIYIYIEREEKLSWRLLKCILQFQADSKMKTAYYLPRATARPSTKKGRQ